MTMNDVIKRAGLAAALALALIPGAAMAQFSDSYNFLKAVRARDGTKATDLMTKPGSVIVDTRDTSTSETALMIVTRARDIAWINFLLSRGAKPDYKDKAGNTALMICAQLGFVEGAQALIKYRAGVDVANSSGETPLIRAVQQRDAAMAQFLLTSGANPAKTDSIAGLSARDYALRDRRALGILKLIDTAKPVKPAAMAGPK
jgi:uncharacterized protein